MGEAAGAIQGRLGVERIRLVMSNDIQFVSDESGNATAVIVPIELWREMESERETAYLLKSPAMRQRLLDAKDRDAGLSFEEAVEKLRA